MKLDRVACLLMAVVLPAAVLAQDLLDPEIAFKATTRMLKPGTIEVTYETAPGYYLYRDRLAYAVTPADAKLGKPALPPGKINEDDFFGKSVIYRNRTVVRVPVTASPGAALTFTADLQGCADIGVCYPPVRRTFALTSGPAPASPAAPVR